MSTSTLVVVGIIVVLMVAVVVLYVVNEPVNVEVVLGIEGSRASEYDVINKSEKQVRDFLEGELNSYWECSECGKIYRYDDYKDYLYGLSTLYNHMMIAGNGSYMYGRNSMWEEYHEVKLIQTAISSGDRSNVDNYKKINTDLSKVVGHKHIDIDYALQYCEGLNKAMEITLENKEAERISKYLSKNAE